MGAKEQKTHLLLELQALFFESSLQFDILGLHAFETFNVELDIERQRLEISRACAEKLVHLVRNEPRDTGRCVLVLGFRLL